MGEGVEANSDAGGEKIEIEIDGKVYDVTKFKHPGGNIIKFLDGQDATDAFNAFHDRSEKARNYLKTIPARKGALVTTKSNDAFVQDFRALRELLRSQGFFEPSLAELSYRSLEIISLFAAGYYLVANGWYYSGIVVLGVVQGRCGWFMHEGGHYSLTTNINVDRALQIIAYNIGSGMSAAYWRNQHNKHHATPQKLEHDVDLNTLPLIAFHKLIAKKGPGNPVWLRFQAFLWFFPITLLTTLGWAFYLHPRFVIRTRNYAEMLAFVVRYLICGYIISQVGFVPFVKGFLLSYWIGGTYIFTLFSVSHTHKDVLKEDEHTDWARYGIDYTTNIQPSFFVNWLMGYLNFQIEHHLFPSMPQFRHPAVSPMVRNLCNKHGIKYDVRSLPQALYDTFSNLNEVGVFAYEQNDKKH